MSDNINMFNQWLLSELKKRGWSKADLARHAEVSPAAITDALSGRRKVGKDLALAFARAFKLPPETVFREVGILPPKKSVDQQQEEIIHLYDQLTENEKDTVLEFIRMLDRLRGKKKRVGNPPMPKQKKTCTILIVVS